MPRTEPGEELLTSLPPREELLTSLPVSDDVAGQLEHRADAAHLQAQLDRLPEAQREVIALAFYGQLTHSEIATQLGLPPGTVKGRMRLGLEKLRAGMEADIARG